MRPRAFTVAMLVALAGWSGSCRSSLEPARLFAEAEALDARYEKAASEQAIAKYQQARDAWQARGDRGHAARAGQRIGAIYWQMGSLLPSLQAYRGALTLAQQAADRTLESEIRSELGTVQAFAADGEAKQQCERALELGRQSNDAATIAKALNCLGEAAYFSQLLDQALESFTEAARLAEHAGNRRVQAQAL